MNIKVRAALDTLKEFIGLVFFTIVLLLGVDSIVTYFGLSGLEILCGLGLLCWALNTMYKANLRIQEREQVLQQKVPY